MVVRRQKWEAREKLSRVEAVAKLAELEDAIEHLRLSYEKYFLGVDRVVPAREHERVERTLRLWEGTPPPGTALRFRLAGLRARFVTYSHYWNRILGQIEKGTYKRDLQRLARKQEPAHRSRAATPAAEETAAEETAAADTTAAETAGAEAGAAEKTPPAADAAATAEPGRAARRQGARGPRKVDSKSQQLPPGMTAREARALFKELVEKKRAAGESTDGLTYGVMLNKLSNPKLRERHGDALRFEVVSDGGRVRLKAKRAKLLG